MARRKKRTRRRSKVFRINAIETGAALSLIAATDAAGAVSQALAGDIKSGFATLQHNADANRSKIIGTLGAAAVAKMITRGFRPVLAKIGPISLSL